jgi:hypothetical protein
MTKTPPLPAILLCHGSGTCLLGLLQENIRDHSTPLEENIKPGAFFSFFNFITIRFSLIKTALTSLPKFNTIP